jgi:RsiW-degrading membrane proteinase PrsW (M82 family)
LNDAALHAFPHELVTSMIGPLLEEVAKAGGLLALILVWPGSLRSVREGIVYGALAGVGFAAIENLGYYTLAAVQGGTPGLAQALYVRGLLEGLNHAAFTAIVGAAAGRARARPASRRPRLAVVAAGLAIAVSVHGAWNGVASTAITSLLCNAPDGAPCAPAPRPLDLLVSVPILIAAFIGPLAALLVMLALRDHRSS